MNCPPDTSISSLTYRFYSSDEIRSLSVRQVTNDLAFDKFTGRGVDGGLHDGAFGPHGEREVCSHCGLDFMNCPGHCGHIEFAKPVYNPFLFDILFKLMKSFCFTCFRIYSVESLAAVLHLLGAPSFKLPGNPKMSEISELEGLSEEDLRALALKNMFMRPRTPCKLCNSGSWIIRHINRQQLVIRPISALGNVRMKSSRVKSDLDGDYEDVMIAPPADDPRLLPNLTSGSLFVDVYSQGENSKMEADYEINLSIIRKELSEILNAQKHSKEISLLPEIARLMLRCLWSHDACLLCLLLPMLSTATSNHKYPTDIFFMENVLLSPSLCRWPRFVGNLAYEHPETAVYVRVVRRAHCLQNIVDFMQQRNDSNNRLTENSLSTQQNAQSSQLDSSNDLPIDIRADGALKLATVLLQAAVNGIYDVNMSATPVGLESKVGSSIVNSTVRFNGLKQRLEKKEGLFRMHMMGKRVNFACRSVISPDPYLSVTEVGVPLFFACRLTYPTPVTTFNLSHLRQLVINGPDIYPGARSLQLSDGRLILLPASNNPQARMRRELLARRLTPIFPGSNGVPNIVHRHLLAGDMLVMNRQPTLHRPSMQAHRVRIITSTGAKTLRMHYSNCKAYNADFDGDEMNGHLVQNYAAQAELETLASVPHQYLVPKDGTPLAGLIQDHVIAAVKLTMRDRFLEYDDYMDLVYHALRPLFMKARQDSNGPPCLILIKPAIYWPKKLWTGKQVISTLLMNIKPSNLPHLNATLRGQRTKAELWSGISPGNSTILSDVDLVVCDGYLASGMLDKSHIGSSSTGLVHCMYEAYGPDAASHLLYGISLLANRLLKYTAFTMGLKDILLSENATDERRRRFNNLRDLGLCAFADAFNLKPEELFESNIKRLYRQAQFAPVTDQLSKKRLAQLDLAMKDRLKRAQDAVCDSAIPSGLYVRFPENNLQLMVHVGAKGGMVNAQQMSVALGQIELEGRRVPLMLSGRTLPSFQPYDVRPRAGGMCTARFLTSLPPQELFFHSMAGRDGLVDTAVKTSRSGYLQRSAIKHLEDLSIRYDGTVRDAGNNIIQFRYGDDGVDVCQSAFLQPTGLYFFGDNADLFKSRWQSFNFDPEKPEFRKLFEDNPLPKHLQLMADQIGIKRQFILMKSPTESKISKILRRTQKFEVFLKQFKQKNNLSKEKLDDNSYSYPPPCHEASLLRELCVSKLISAQAPPGDPIGLLAAQSVGEPSTQMTLNTFHFAGRGEMNVTLGIPRLREILMTGSSQISTPCIEVPIHPTNEAHQLCEQIAKRFYKLKLSEALRLPIGEKVDYVSDSCTLEFNLQPRSTYSKYSNVTPFRVLRFIERVLFPDLARQLDEELKDQGKTNLIKSFTLSALALKKQVDQKSDQDETGADNDEGLTEATNYRRPRARDEWNEDDGHEAVRRRKLEADAEDDYFSTAAHSRNQNIDLDEGVDLDSEDDAEVAELREIGEDPEEKKEDIDMDQDDNANWTSWNDITNSNKSKSHSNLKSVTKLSSSSSKIENTSNNPDQFEYLDSSNVVGDDQELLTENLDVRTEQETSGTSSEEIKSRITFITSLHARFSKYEFDHKNKSPKWARLTICMFDPKEGRISIDLKTLVMRIVNKSVVSSIPGIEKTIIDRSNPNKWMFRIEGTNMIEIMRYPQIFDLSHLYTNSIALMNQTYGIEAARATIQKEVSSVFGHYGIYVNSRHLSLIADYMTKNGTYRAFNRASLSTHPSPLQQMSFETVTNALKISIQENRLDNLVSPSASLITGRLIHYAGTNCFELYQKVAC